MASIHNSNTVYIGTEDHGRVYMSSLPFDHPDTDKYRMVIVDADNVRRPGHITTGILRNILEHAGVKVVIEN